MSKAQTDAANENASEPADSQDKPYPVKTHRLGGMQAAIYHKTSDGDNGEPRKSIQVTFGKRIRNRDGSYQTVRTLYPQDIPAMIAVLQQALRFVQESENGVDAPF